MNAVSIRIDGISGAFNTAKPACSTLVLSELGEVNRLHKSSVEQAGFAVLKAPDIPSILIETAFISNPDEEKKLRDPLHQRKMADAIADGIRRYFAKNPPLARA